MLAIALVLLAAVYVPHYVGRAQTTRTLEASFADAGLDPFCIDPALSQEENLAQAEKDLALLHGALAAADVPALVPGLVTAHELFPEFREAFLARSPYEGISRDRYDVGETALVDGAEVACYFFTDPQDEWDEHSEAYLWIRVEPAD